MVKGRYRTVIKEVDILGEGVVRDFCYVWNPVINNIVKEHAEDKIK